MGFEPVGLSNLVEEIRHARAGVEAGDAKMSSRIASIEQSVNTLFKRIGRPGRETFVADDEIGERKDAAELCVIKHHLTVPKNDGNGARLHTVARRNR